MYLHAGIELLTEENRERNVRWREMTGVEGGGAVFAIGCSAISVQKSCVRCCLVLLRQLSLLQLSCLCGTVSLNLFLTPVTTLINFMQQYQDAVNIDDLSTAKFHYGGVAVKKDNAGKDKWHVAYEATVTAGVKMSDITFEVDDTAKTVTPILPKPTIGDVVVDSGSLDFFENNPSVEIDEVIKLCKQDAQQETKTNGDIISIAASNLEQTVDALTKDLVEAKGYKLQKAETVKLTKETAHADE